MREDDEIPTKKCGCRGKRNPLLCTVYGVDRFIHARTAPKGAGHF